MAGSVVVLLAFTVLLRASDTDRQGHSSYRYEAAQAHELKPHRRTIPLEGVTPCLHQLRLTVTVSAAGEVTRKASGDPETVEFWPRVQAEVRAWKFTPFEKNGKTVTAEVEEYVDLVPPERLPNIQVEPPVLRADSEITIVLKRTGCYGTCPAYTVTIDPANVVFEGNGFVIANPTADLSGRLMTSEGGGLVYAKYGPPTILMCAAESGNPEAVREVLRYRPNVAGRDRKGRTALFAAVEYSHSDEEGARVEIVRLLVKAGADVNARDDDGNTALHETFLTDVEEELLKRGADVNARNDEGETPIFTTVDNDAIPLFIAHGADLTIRNLRGETVFEAAKQRGPSREAALEKALQKLHE